MLKLHQQVQIQEYYDLMDILLNLIYLNKYLYVRPNLKIKTISFIPTLIIITGKTREIAKNNDAASRKKLIKFLIKYLFKILV